MAKRNGNLEQALETLQSLSNSYADSVANEFERLTIRDGALCVAPGQMQKIREDQVENNAGGYVFPVSDETRIRRFLILGTNGGTYYTTEKELTMENVEAMIDIINRGKAGLLLKEIYEISVAGRNPKQEPVLLALALCARYRTHYMKEPLKSQDPAAAAYSKYILAMHKAAFSIVNDVCRIPTHLFGFVAYCEQVASQTNPIGKQKSSGWGRSMRTAIQNWYSAKNPEQLAMHITKYKSRNNWSHRDLFRLAHPLPSQNKTYEDGASLEIEQIYHYAVKGSLKIRKRRLSKEEYDVEEPEKKYGVAAVEKEAQSKALDLIEKYMELNKDTKPEEAAKAIREQGLVREHIPTELLNSKEIWEALIEKMPMTALVRNLGKISAIGALTPALTAKICQQLEDEEQLRKSRIHPIQVLIAKCVYGAGHGDKGSLKWDVNDEINKSLETAFYKSFINAPPTNKRICFAFDVSGSMTWSISGTSLDCRTASAALSLISLRNEEKTECVGFSHELIKLPYNGTYTIDRICKHMDGLPFGSTDCALPMLWAKKNKKKFDVFIVYTDCETYYGDVHPFEALKQYRESSGISDARLIVMGMTAMNFTIADPSDAGMLDIVGFDSAVPQLIHEFVTGNL